MKSLRVWVIIDIIIVSIVNIENINDIFSYYREL